MNIQPQYTNFVISFSFKNYLKAKSGMPKVILSHQTAINNDGVSYVYLYSVKKNILNDRYMLFCYYGLIVDGIDYGIFSIDQIIKAVAMWQKAGHKLLNFHIHHLLFTDVKKIGKLLDSFETVPVKFFLHDYYLCCKSYHLLDANGVYCRAEYLGAQQCSNCEYFTDNETLKEMRAFVGKYIERAQLISPSEYTKEVYSKFNPRFSEHLHVIAHQKFDGQYTGNADPVSEDRPIRVGYLGVSESYKGWDIWKALVNSCIESDDYAFYVFNNRKMDYDDMHHMMVEYTSSNQNAMVDAVRNAGIDVVVFWPKTPETYSYTCMEAYASNVFMITNPISGNIQDFVKRNDTGMVLDNEQELIDLFRDPAGLREIINRHYSKKCYPPQNLLDNDAVCDLFKDLRVEEKKERAQCRIRKNLQSYLLQFLYEHFVHKY